MFRRFFAWMAAPAILFLGITGAEAATITLVPSSIEVTVGSTFEIDVIAEDVNLGGFDLFIGFNPTLVTITTAGPDRYLGDTTQFEAFFASYFDLDAVQVMEVSLLDSATLTALQGNAPLNSFRIATLSVDALAPGIATFAFGQTDLTDPEANELIATFVGAEVTIVGDSGEPAPTPEPGGWTAVAGLALIFVSRLRRA